ncbi:VOC family protein [Planctomonas sp. JC2975]|uniref:VOC family protein n=1 Tax=Planctomonas sp. JC2975 TaxID=2729626 RepID=UPI003211D571
MRTILTGITVSDPAASVAFYGALGYEVVGSVAEAEIGALTMLKLPDEEFVSIELVADGTVAGGPAAGLNHIAIQVDDLEDLLGRLRDAGVSVGEVGMPGGATGPRTCMLSDPDGYAIELTQWQPGHPTGLTVDDFRAD